MKLRACLPPVSSILYKSILALKANQCGHVKLGIDSHRDSFSFIFSPFPSICKKKKKRWKFIAEGKKKKRKERNDELPNYVNIYKYQGSELGNTIVQPKVKTCQKVLESNRAFCFAQDALRDSLESNGGILVFSESETYMNYFTTCFTMP